VTVDGRRRIEGRQSTEVSMILPFSIGRLPRIEFGAGAVARLPQLVAGYGRRVLLVTGAQSFDRSAHAAPLLAALSAAGLSCERVKIAGEPSPDDVDDAVCAWRGRGIDVVVGIGGGSALDAAKAIAGLLKPGNSVMEHLEGVGPELPYRGPATPFIAVPTTAGTGSEATKNAVLSRGGPGGFKKSFRDDALVAEVALVDPDLLVGCPPAQIAANGMDALTQLLESYVSTRANPVTEALAVSGLCAVRDGLLAWYGGDDAAGEVRSRMAYASLLSGICLAQTGLGSVHGLASPLGALFPIPHGVVCGTLLADATAVNIAALEARAPGDAALAKYAEVGRLLSRHAGTTATEDRAGLVRILAQWAERMALPRLSGFGVAPSDLDRIVAASRGSSMKTNPVVLTDDEIRRVVIARL
jgi:alcohol dehydrogenase